MSALFQKRHYIALAKVLHKYHTESGTVLDILAEMLERDNPNFDRERFELAANEGKVVGEDIQGGPAMPSYKGGNRLMRR